MAENSIKSVKPVKRGPGRPFQPGQSGNPGGRPKESGEIRDLARQYSEEALQTLVNIMRKADKDTVRIVAAQIIIERGCGKPLTAAEIAEEDRKASEELSKLSDKELADMLLSRSREAQTG